MPASIAFDARFTERHPLFWPIAPAARAFAGESDWPAVESYGRAFAVGDTAASPPPVRFEAAAAPPRRRRQGPVDRGALYDARIVHGVVPTRPRSWHDFLNALVWATFPRAKRALHERQHRALDERLADGARVLPSTRSREHDTLALLDEGGVVLVEDAGATHLVVFGHALYEGLVLGRPPPTACGLRARLPSGRNDAPSDPRPSSVPPTRRSGSTCVKPRWIPRVCSASRCWNTFQKC